MNNHTQIQTIRLGDRVNYHGSLGPDQPLKSSSQGRLVAFVTFGKATLAEVEWDSPGPPRRVNVGKLSLVSGDAAQAA